MDDATPLVAARLNARVQKPAKSTLIPLLIAVALTVVISLALAIRDNPEVLHPAPTNASPAYATTLEAHLMGALTFQGVISVLVGLSLIHI